MATEGDLLYRSARVVGSRVVSSAVALSDGAGFQDSARLGVVCGQDGVTIETSNIGRGQFLTVPGEAAEVTWRIGSGGRKTTAWDAWLSVGRQSISPQDAAALYAAMRNAESLSFSVGSDPVVSGKYDLVGNGLWSTPFQPNLDACAGS